MSTFVIHKRKHGCDVLELERDDVHFIADLEPSIPKTGEVMRNITLFRGESVEVIAKAMREAGDYLLKHYYS